MDEEEHRKEFLRWCENKRIRDAIRSGSDLSSYKSDSEQLAEDFDLLEFVDRIEWVADQFSRKQIYDLTRAEIQAHDDEVREALKATINQPTTSKVKVQRWFPGVVQYLCLASCCS